MGRKHKIGLIGASSYVVGCMIGSGIFVTPAGILKETGSPGLSLVVWLFSGLISLLGGLTYTELGTSIRLSGADFAYICYVGWKPVAFLFLWSSAVIYEPCELAIMSKTFSEYVVAALPNANTISDYDRQLFIMLIGLCLMYVLIFTNMFRFDRYATGIQVVTTVAKVASLAVIVIIGIVWLAQGKGFTINEVWSFSNTSSTPSAFILATYSGLWSYAGWETLNFGMEEIANPKRNVPIAVLAGTVFMAIVYMLVNMAYLAVLGPQGLLSNEAVAQTFANITWKPLGYIMPVLVGVTVAGSFNADIFSASRVYFTGARGGQLPSFLGLLHIDHRTPQPALIFMAICSTAAMQIQSIDSLINAVMFLQWMQRACAVAALLWIRYKKIPVHKDAIKFPIVFHILFFLLCVALVIMPIYDNPTLSAVGFGIILSAAVIYFLLVRLENKPMIFHRIDKILGDFCQRVLLCEPDYDSLRHALDDTSDSDSANGEEGVGENELVNGTPELVRNYGGTQIDDNSSTAAVVHRGHSNPALTED